MDSGSLTIGFTCGAIIGVTVGWYLSGQRAGDVSTVAERQSDSVIVPRAGISAPTVSNSIQEPASEDDQEFGNPPTSSGTSTDPVAPWPDNLRADLYLEPKDDSWAYYMEQTLLQYLAAHPSISQFDVLSIECRTTKCQIEVTGYDESTLPVWQQVMYDIRQQPWNEFGQYGSSSGTVDGQHTIVGLFHRISESK